MKTKKYILALLVMSIVAVSCKKEEELICIDNSDPLADYVATPHTVSLPNSVLISPFGGELISPVYNPLTVEGIALGRKLFYDKKLSGDNTMACASCHLQEDGFSDKNQFSEGISGDFGDRQAMAIFNLGWDELFFWDGRSEGLEAQAFGPVTNPIELNATWPDVVAKLQADAEYPALFKKAFDTYRIDSVLVSQAISQFERTMVSFNSRFDKFMYEGEDVFNDSEERGFDLFFDKAECIHCHSGPMLNDPSFRNNGLDVVFIDKGLGKVTGDPTDNGKFKVTSLRNIAQTAPYMHDGRFATLEDVIEHYDSGVDSLSPNLDPEMFHFAEGLELTNQEKADLIAFLKTFTDDEFLTNPDFSDPNE